MPKVSIITTTYNHSKYIWETIESILNQTFSDWELLVWDDNSHDNTFEIVSKYINNDSRIKAWKHKKNIWIIWNLNFLIDKVSKDSEYIAFLEWDDLFTSDNLERKLKIFNKYHEVVMIYNNLDFIDWNSEIFYKDFLRKAPFYLKNKKLKKEQFIKNETFYWSYSTLMIKKNVLDKEKIINPTNDKLYTVSDWDLFFRISTKYNCYWIKDSLTLYRRHSWNLSWQYLKLFNDLEIQINEYKKNNFINDKLYNYKLSFINILRSVYYLEKIDRKNSLKYLKKSFRNNLFWNLNYKIWVFIINLLPSFLITKILKKLIKR